MIMPYGLRESFTLSCSPLCKAILLIYSKHLIMNMTLTCKLFVGTLHYFVHGKNTYKRIDLSNGQVLPNKLNHNLH